MEQEWVSLSEYMRRNHIGYETALKLIHSGKVEYQKIGGQYKIKVSKDKEVNATIEKLINCVIKTKDITPNTPWT